MKQFIVAAVVVMLSSVSVLAQTTSTIDAAKKYKGAPGPVVGAGLPALAIGYGVYWLVKRRKQPKV